MDKYIEKIRDQREQQRRKRDFNVNRALRLTYTHKEPEGWPLTRPLTKHEWAHALKVMIMRRVPKHGPIHRTKLVMYVSEDLNFAGNAGKLYVDNDFIVMRKVDNVLNLMCARDQTLRSAPRMEDPEMRFPAEAIYRTERAESWEDRVPKTVRVVVDQLPTTSVLDLLVQGLLDAE